MDNTVNYFKKLDLSEIEAKLYLTLLKDRPFINTRSLAQNRGHKTDNRLFLYRKSY